MNCLNLDQKLQDTMKLFKMNFPYALDYEENIVHHIMNCIIQDNECDKLILKQAIDLRDEQSKK